MLTPRVQAPSQIVSEKARQSVSTGVAPHGGRYTDNEGTLILSRLPLVDQSTMNSTERGFSRAVVNVGGVPVTIFNAHLDWDSGMRSARLEAFLAWGQRFGGPKIAGGDFNIWWGEWWIGQMESLYSDTWQDVTGVMKTATP